MNDGLDEHRPIPPQPSGFPSTITVNVNLVLSGGFVIEFKNSGVDLSAEVERLAAVNARNKASADALKKAADSASAPNP